MTRKLDKTNRIGFVFVAVLVSAMALILGGLYFIDQDTDAQRVRDVALNLHIEDTTCDNVALAMDANERSFKDRVVRDELQRVWNEGNCGMSVVP